MEYNDNHVEFEGTNRIHTNYTGGGDITADDLFVTGDVVTPPATVTGKDYDAAMAYQDKTTLVNQK